MKSHYVYIDIHFNSTTNMPLLLQAIFNVFLNYHIHTEWPGYDNIVLLM